MQGFGAGVVLGLVLVFGSAAGELCLGRLEFGLEGHLVHFGDQLSGLDLVVVVGVEFVDDTRYLRTDLDLRDRFDRSGRRHRVADGDVTYGSRFEPDLRPF